MNVDLESLEELIRTADIEGYLAEGAPQDEYDLEIATLLSGLHAIPPGLATREKLIALLETVWQSAFSLPPADLLERRSAFEAIADKLLHFFPA